VKEKNPRFLFLMETKMSNKKMQRIRSLLAFEGMLTVDPVGRSRGLVFLWKDVKEVEI
jgi:hypothetical protein